MKSDEVVVYWSPMSNPVGDQEIPYENNWRILYEGPQNLYDYYNSLRFNKGQDNFLTCPSVTGMLKSTFYFRNLIESEYTFNFVEDSVEVNPTSKRYMSHSLFRKPSVSIGPLFELGLGFVFFAEEPLVATFTPPFFHKSDYLQYGSIIPGEFDIGQWIRPYLFEVQCWEKSGVFKIKENEPIFYIRFNTDKKIIFKEFNISNDLKKMMSTNISIRKYFPTNGLLKRYYYLFNRSKMKDIVLSEIKKNLVINND